MKKRAPDQQPWMSPPDYGRSLRPGIGFNLLVTGGVLILAATVDALSRLRTGGVRT